MKVDLSLILKLLKWIAILVVTVVIAQQLNKCDRGPGEGNVVVSQAFLDSLEYIASLPPDTIKGDPIYIKGDPVTIKGDSVPYPVYIDTNGVKTYQPKLENDSISVWMDLKLRGELIEYDWHYTPIIKEIPVEIIKKEPYGVPYDVEVLIPQRGFYGTLGIGKGFDIGKPAFSGEIFLITKKESLVGFEVGHFQEGYFKVKFGTKF